MPPIEIVPIGIPLLVVFVMVTGIGALAEPTATLPKFSEVTELDMVIPKPVSGMTCEPVISLSVIVRLPEAGPAAPGLNVTLIVHVPAAAIVPTQLLVCWNGPVVATLCTVMEVEFLFVKVTGTEALVVPTIWFPKFSDVADNPMPVPVPVREIVCVPRVLVNVMEPVRVPKALGVNLNVTVQKCPGSTPAVVQLLVSEKSPVAATLLKVAVLVV